LLLVEDDFSTRTALSYLLTANGWEVVTAATLEEGRRQIAQTVPDAVILDLMLPDGDGTAILRQIRDLRPNLPVAVTTGVIDPAWLQRVTALSPTCILLKPIQMGELLKHL
jgi:DNA-binding response OmpR family regulator